MNRERKLSLALMLLVFGLLALLVYLRIQVVERNIGTYIACVGCFDSTVIMADLVMISLAAGILLLAGLLRPHWLGRIMHLALGVLILVYVADLVTFRLFNSRLFLSDAALFITERAAVWDQFSTGLGGPWVAWGIVGGILLLFIALASLPPIRTASLRLVLAGMLVVSLTSGMLLTPQLYVNDWAVTNVFSANLATSERVQYSQDTIGRTLARPPARTRVESATPAGPAARRNVILIMLESWSTWHSALFGGYENWTPHMDAAALDGVRFTNFHSIGFSTDKGLVGILAGQPIWSPFLNWFETPPFHSMWGIERTLPRAFTQQGYTTAFLTSGPLTLYQKGEWLHDLGFDLAEGNEHPFYEGLPRYAFDSASDEALYARAEEWRQAATEPYLLVLETVTTHQPYNDPDSGERSLELAMKYADRAFGVYLEQLRDSGFFETGVLAVISDHRSMTPIPAREIHLLGNAAFSQVPAFLIGTGFGVQVADDHVYSQSDLVPSFELWLSGTTELEPLQSVMFGQALQQPEDSGNSDAAQALHCAFHSRGDLRGVVEVVCDKGRGQIRLDGDETRFTESEGLDEPDHVAILDRLASLRLEGVRRQELHEAALTAQQE